MVITFTSRVMNENTLSETTVSESLYFIMSLYLLLNIVVFMQKILEYRIQANWLHPLPQSALFHDGLIG